VSTIKSSAENLTLNADGANNDIKFQSNGVEKASIDQDGLVTCAGSTMSGVLTVNSGANLGFKANGTVYTQIWQTLQSPNDLTLKTTADKFISFQPNSVEKVRIHSSGVTSFNDGIELGSGLDATAANTLDDYEEGTWTPTITGSTSGSGTQGNGYYTKIGNVCTINIKINNAALPTIAGELRFSIPFTSASNQEHHGGDIYFYPLSSWTSGSNFAGLTPKVGADVAYHTFMIKGVDADRQTTLTSTNSSISAATVYCRYSLTYITV
jgi:hypothetical protein